MMRQTGDDDAGDAGHAATLNTDSQFGKDVRVNIIRVTLFERRRPGGEMGWAWSIGRSAREGGTIYSTRTCEDAKAAHADAWHAR